MRCIYIGSLNKQTAVTEAGIHVPPKDTRRHRKKLYFYLVEPGVSCLLLPLSVCVIVWLMLFVRIQYHTIFFGDGVVLRLRSMTTWQHLQKIRNNTVVLLLKKKPSFLIVSPGFIGKWLYKESLTSSCTLVYCTMQFKWKNLIARTGLDWVQNITNINTYKQTKIQNSFYSMAMYNSLNMIHLSANYSVALVKYCL